MKRLVTAVIAMSLAGCAPVLTEIKFSNRDEGQGKLVSGTITGRLKKVQEFRSLLEALEYRVTEKSK